MLVRASGGPCGWIGAVLVLFGVDRNRCLTPIGRVDGHAAPFVDLMPSPPGATACRNDWPSALYAASATW